ncbi:GpU protein [Hydrogenoanaerobacterium saccharovorans]|uniref:Phage P2 GpU n=1 Tax=Hydrogenoanaerobacterium saccharovorans TaxID=474960 RepID=A0A1H7ZYQ2_9FIRM|nr:phage tail protein [Hydrogenoanaerobacterium saccharovorans]RPF48266.1 GpU protein [Hydrogenoanaerobacterium saccharovorans]SEM63792.1 Phage P2 GpU [Hydrogenoanaerobacterium saccharovorans]
MAVIGSWSNIVFSVSRREIKTFDSLKWNFGAKYATHEVHLKDPILEFVGTDVETISFSMLFSAFLGVNPMTEINKLHNAVRKGKVSRLIIGKKTFGKNKWVITKVENQLERYDNRGNLLAAKANVTMQAYGVR